MSIAVKGFRFVDNQEMVVQTKSGLHSIIAELSKTGKKYDMKIKVCRDGSKRKGGNVINTRIYGQIIICPYILVFIRASESVSLFGITHLR